MKKLMKKVVPAIALAAMVFSSLHVSADWEAQPMENWKYAKPSGYAVGWENINGLWYYFYPNGMLTAGWVYDNGNGYYMDKNGAMTTGWQKVDGKWFYMHENGVKALGWTRIGNQWYFLNTKNGQMETGWLCEGDEKQIWYYLDDSGAMATGWRNINGTWYFMGDDGAMITNAWIEGSYYVGENGAMATNTYIGDYYVGSDGKWIPGYPVGTWQQDANGWWLLTNDGNYIANSWAKINGSWYYFDERGYIYMNRWKDNYYLGETGAMVVSSWIDGNKYYVNYEGEWIPNYSEDYFPAGEYKAGVDLKAGTYALKAVPADRLAVAVKSKNKHFTETNGLKDLYEKAELTETENSRAEWLLMIYMEEGYAMAASGESSRTIIFEDGDFVFVRDGYLYKRA